jgi:transketolase
MGWHGWVGLDGAVVAGHAFGTSAPLQDLKNRFGLTPQVHPWHR